MTPDGHTWTVTDGEYLSDGGWHCERCQSTAMFWVDVRTIPACIGRLFPWSLMRRLRFRAAVNHLRPPVGVAPSPAAPAAPAGVGGASRAGVRLPPHAAASPNP